MQAQLRGLMSPDISDLRSYAPSQPFSVFIRAMIGPAGSAGEEAFDFTVCSPEWLAKELESRPVVSGRGLLIASAFDYEAVEAHVRSRIAHATGDEWGAIAQKLNRSFSWEFEDYPERT